MLQFLRKKENAKKVMWALAILIIPAFVLWGSGNVARSKNLPKYAGKIFGQKISFQQYEEALLACRNQNLLIYGEDFNKIAKFLDLDKEVWEWLILVSAAKKEKIKVPNQEIIDFIQRIPFFQDGGRFNQRRYDTILNYTFRTRARAFEEQIRALLKVEKLKDKLTSQISVTDAEVEKVYQQENEKARAWYVFVDPAKFSEQIHPAYEELNAHYQKHKNQFNKPEQANVQYIALYFDQERPNVSVSEEEIENYYQTHLNEFSLKDKEQKESPKPFAEVQTQIQEKLTQDKLRTTLEEKIWKISDAIGDKPESFENVAKENQLEVKETGFFGPEQTIAEIGLSYEFLNTAFSLKLGQVSNIIETPKGYFILKLKEKKPAYIPALEEVQGQVEQAVLKEKSWQVAKDKTEEILAQIKKLIQEEKLDFAKAAEKLTLTAKETEEFSKTASYISEIGQSQKFSQAAFALEAKEVSDLIEVPNGYCILSLKEIIPIEQEKFAQEKEEFAKKVLVRKKGAFYRVWLAELKKKASLENNMGELKNQETP